MQGRWLFCLHFYFANNKSCYIPLYGRPYSWWSVTVLWGNTFVSMVDYYCYSVVCFDFFLKKCEWSMQNQSLANADCVGYWSLVRRVTGPKPNPNPNANPNPNVTLGIGKHWTAFHMYTQLGHSEIRTSDPSDEWHFGLVNRYRLC